MDSGDKIYILDDLLNIMSRLRDPETGCEWDTAQNFTTIAPYTIEEAYEVANAIVNDDMNELCEELGDLLFQVVFHSQMAKEAKYFTIADVISSICRKMIRRHPHIFTEYNQKVNLNLNWEQLKEQERKSKNSDTEASSALDGVAHALPALMRAEKLQKRAARTGFDWPKSSGALDKLHEELAELDAAQSPEHQREEAGDVLFSMVNYLRHLGIDAEQALREANDKFTNRFVKMESYAGDGFNDLPLDEKEQLWLRAKRNIAAE